MCHRVLAIVCLAAGPLFAADESFSYEVIRSHELKPHRSTIPLEGVSAGGNQLHLRVQVSAAGDVIDAKATGTDYAMYLWPQVHAEVMGWKFKPFEMNGKPVTLEFDEYVDLVPPEQVPAVHIAPPIISASSKVIIELTRSGCYGSCPDYHVSITSDGIVFEGTMFVVAGGKHTATVDPEVVRDLAKRFIDADFYSMQGSYRASVTDIPTYSLGISIDGDAKVVQDYDGQLVGMPAVIKDLEGAIDELAQTERWIQGSDGLVEALRSEGFHFDTPEGQIVLKGAAGLGQVETVRELLQAGVPLTPLTAAEPEQPNDRRRNAPPIGWLETASGHPAVLKILIDAGASQHDQHDKNAALATATRFEQSESARLLIAYGAQPMDSELLRRDRKR
jgi:hypothetical protein